MMRLREVRPVMAVFRKHVLVVALLIASAAWPTMNTWAAKKYYPPGFVPPPDAHLIPGSVSPPKVDTPPAKPTIIKVEEPAPPPQTIIKTVTVTAPVKPKDTLTTLIDENHYADALRLVDSRLKKSYGNLSLRLVRAQLLRERGSYDQAEAEYRFIIGHSRTKNITAKAYPGLGLTLLLRAQQVKRQGDVAETKVFMDAAKVVLDQAAKVAVNEPATWTTRARYAICESKLPEAEYDVRRASNIAPSDTQVLLAKSELLLAQKKPEETLQLLYKVRKQSPNDSRGNLLLGEAYLLMNRSDDAIIQLQQTLEKSPNDVEALKLLSKAYGNKARPEDAELVLQKTLIINPADTDSAQALMKIYDERGDTDRSTLLLRGLLKEQPQQVIYQQELLDRLAQQGNLPAVVRRGDEFVSLALSGSQAQMDESTRVIDLYVFAQYTQTKGLLDRRAFLAQPTIQKLHAYYIKRLDANTATLDDQFNLLLLDPLAISVTPIKPDTVPIEQWPLGLKLSYLQGDATSHAFFLKNLSQSAQFTASQFMTLAEELLVIGDYTSANQVLGLIIHVKPDNTDTTTTLSQKIAQTQKMAADAYTSLKLLPANMPRNHWQQTAEEALRLGAGNWQVHALISDNLKSRHETELALMQARLALRFAPANEKSRFLKKIKKFSLDL